MASTKTIISDVIVPVQFESYVVQRTSIKSDFVQSGIVVSDPAFDALAAGPGKIANMPFWNDVNNDRQPLSDVNALTTMKITAGDDIACIQNDGQAWSVNSLAALLAGSDPMAAIGGLLGDYWSRQNQQILLNSLSGMFGAASMASNLLNIASQTTAGISAATKLTGSTFIDACTQLGDRADRLTAVAMHSATEAALRKLDLIDFIQPSTNEPQIRVFQGRRIIIDDGCPVAQGTGAGAPNVYTTYLFGPGAFAQGSAPLTQPVEGGFGTQGVELARAALGSDTMLINRRRFILHPRGVQFTSTTVAGANPTNAELSLPANWVRVYEPKNVRIVAVVHNN